MRVILFCVLAALSGAAPAQVAFTTTATPILSTEDTTRQSLLAADSTVASVTAKAIDITALNGTSLTMVIKGATYTFTGGANTTATGGTYWTGKTTAGATADIWRFPSGRVQGLVVLERGAKFSLTGSTTALLIAERQNLKGD